MIQRTWQTLHSTSGFAPMGIAFLVLHLSIAAQAQNAAVETNVFVSGEQGYGGKDKLTK
jgi:succinate dehydrogenase/fumarate reductase cytochrome b subunit